MDILNYIPVGHKNAITRHALRVAAGMSDRKIRELIEESNIKNPTTPIINVQDGKGYFIPDIQDPEDVRELKKYVALQKSRIKQISRSSRGARNMVKSL